MSAHQSVVLPDSPGQANFDTSQTKPQLSKAPNQLGLSNRAHNRRLAKCNLRRGKTYEQKSVTASTTCSSRVFKQTRLLPQRGRLPDQEVQLGQQALFSESKLAEGVDGLVDSLPSKQGLTYCWTTKCLHTCACILDTRAFRTFAFLLAWSTALSSPQLRRCMPASRLFFAGYSNPGCRKPGSSVAVLTQSGQVQEHLRYKTNQDAQENAMTRLQKQQAACICPAGTAVLCGCILPDHNRKWMCSGKPIEKRDEHIQHEFILSSKFHAHATDSMPSA